MNTTPLIIVHHLWKHYGLPLPRVVRFLAGGKKTSDHAALQDISFELNRGETLGVIGYNGAGKSTLLKVLAGVTPPTSGSVSVSGTVFPMIELNAGLHPEMTGRENVRLLGALMGFSRRALESRMAAIKEFCELGEWFDMPVRMYSNGMLVRLGFSVAINVQAEVLLIDEVLAVGDLPFQRKCYTQIERLRRHGASIVFVSHNIRQVERISDRVMLLHNGSIKSIGNPEEVCLMYHRMSSAREMSTARTMLPDAATWQGSGELIIECLTILDNKGNTTSEIEPLSPLRIRVHYHAHNPIESPIIGLRILTDDMMRVAEFTTGDRYPGALLSCGSGWFEATVISLPLLPGIYTIGLTIKCPDGRTVYIGDNLAFFSISYAQHTKNSFGIVHLDAIWLFPAQHHTGESAEAKTQE